jgi:glucosamine--fructose-6-phosphate aminotransferase (isomerizing)
MCGIIARVGADDAAGDLLGALKTLEYRGYDSAGIAVQNGHGIEVHKREGRITDLEAALSGVHLSGNVGIGHTRWSTHGAPSDENAHPHTDCTGSVAVVHNGIIENYNDLRERLVDRGHEFESETDTEVIPHLMEEHLKTADPETAFRRTIAELSGSYAVAMLVRDEKAVFATRSGSPLVLGLGEDEYFLASDIPAFLRHTSEVIYLEDGDVVHLTPEGYSVSDADGRPVDHAIQTVEWDPEDVGKGGYKHYMLKEIHEQPNALRQTIRGRIDSLNDDVVLDAFPEGSFDEVTSVQLVACGTSYHAALYAACLLNESGVPAQAFLANEYGVSEPPIPENALVVGVSQSGETADTLTALRYADAVGARTLVVTNVVDSTAARECTDAMYIRAGPEIGVAATKTFTSQVASLALLSERLIRDVTGTPSRNATALLDSLSRLPSDLQDTLDSSNAEELAERFDGSDAYFFIGRGYGYPVALEGALKFKEISYEHAEGFAAGELKHGPLALVTPDTPVFAVFTGMHTEKMLNNVKEVQSRGAPVVAIVSEDDEEVHRVADAVLTFPDAAAYASGIMANVQLQLLAYYAADQLGRPIDKPRNLAKSVTVE